MSSVAIKYGKDVEVEYVKYIESYKHTRHDARHDARCGGKSLTLEEYADYLNRMRSAIGELINSDPKDQHSGIGRKIFRHLQGDVRTAIAFSCVSRGLKERSTRYWFVNPGHEFVFKYIQRGTGYKDYLKEKEVV